MAVALFAVAACGRATNEPDGALRRGSPGEASTFVSYAGAAGRLDELGRLDGLDPTEVEEQLRDWARSGLASLLELDTAQFRDAFYDTMPVRDPAFADLAAQPTGPGRSLYDGRGVLHLLVPHDDPHEARTVGLLIDDFRADAGRDAEQVRIHQYEIHAEDQTIELTSRDPAPTAEVRAAHGYVEMRVDQAEGLTAFLAQTQHLSLLETRGAEIWAGGWWWPDTPGAQLTYEDVSVIQRGYLGSPSTEPTRFPGFSLDPQPPGTADDILAVAPGTSPELAARLAAGERPADLLETIDNALFSDVPVPAGAGLPSDRTQLWALGSMLTGGPGYSQARYDGGLEGTEVGMTLFYTDFVAKDWTWGVGSGAPTDAVAGFLRNPEAVVPWSHCEDSAGDESGRLWFGQSESGFTYDDDGVTLGAHATRLFARSDGDGGAEVEQSYGFGRGLRWWDQHYQAIADYEPQYHRLDQIMRWSGAIEWLALRNGAALPQLSDGEIHSKLRFQDWYAARDDLRERSPIVFVQPPTAAGNEVILAKPSEAYDSCGAVRIGGGVSLGDLSTRRGGRSFDADLPTPVRRAGLVEEASAFDTATGTGRITHVSLSDTVAGQVVDRVQRTFSATPDGPAAVEVVGGGRRVASLGDLKIDRAGDAPRRLTAEYEAGAGRISQQVSLQDLSFGAFEVQKSANTVTIQWRPGLLERFRQAARSVQDRWVSEGGAQPPSPTGGVWYSLEGAPGRVVHRIGDGNAPWLEITNELSAPGEAMAFRLSIPDPRGGPARVAQARLVPPPEVQAAWIEVAPRTAGGPARLVEAQPPPPGAPTVRVEGTNGGAFEVSLVGDRPRVRADDPFLGLGGRAEGAALLADFPRARDAMSSAARAGDGLYRAFPLDGGGAAFGGVVGGVEGVIVRPAGHPWATRVLEAIDPRAVDLSPAFRFEGDRALHVDMAELQAGPARVVPLEEMVANPPRDMYASEGVRSRLAFEDGAVIVDPLLPGSRVLVREATPSEPTGAARPPDVHRFQGRDWYRVPTGGGSPPSGQVALVSSCEEDGQPVVPECAE